MYQIDVGAMQGMDQMQDSVFPFNLLFDHQVFSTILSAYADWQPGNLLREPVLKFWLKKSIFSLKGWLYRTSTTTASNDPWKIQYNFKSIFFFISSYRARMQRRLLTPYYYIPAEFL